MTLWIYLEAGLDAEKLLPERLLTKIDHFIEAVSIFFSFCLT